MSRLESLGLGFQYPRSQAHRASRHPPSLTRVVLPNLTFFYFGGDIEYLEDILSQIETPILNQSNLYLFNKLLFDTPPLGYFIRRTRTFVTIHKVRLKFCSWAAKVTLLQREEVADNDRQALRLEIICKPFEWQLSAVA